jgi:ferredoxin
MRRKSTTGSGAVAELSAIKGAGSQSLEASPEETSAAFPQLDFLSSEFNSMDELDDNRGNYRSFQSLAGIVTSDMRHHQKLKQLKLSAGSITEITEITEIAEAEEKEDVESRSEEAVNVKNPLPLTIVSRGCLLVIDKNLERAINYAEFLNNNGMTCTLCVPNCGGSDFPVSRIGSLVLVEVDSVSVSGGFGGFTSVVTGADGRQENLSALIGHLSTVTGHDVGIFDLVLDLQPAASFLGKQLPVGYYAPGEDKIRIEAALLELPEMRGRFKKQQLTVLQENRCLHGRSRSHDCFRCLQICPVTAIKSENRKIAIDQYLCQGCGACALVCPSDAIQLLNPAQEELLSELAGALSESAAMDTTLPDVFLYDGDIDEHLLKSSVGITAARIMYVEVEDIGRIGLEVLLVALAYGAGSVTLVCDRQRPVEIREALEQQVQLGAEILRGLQLPPDCIRFVIWSQASEQRISAGSSRSSIPPATFTFDHDKRTLLYLAAQYFLEAYGTPGTSQPAIVLPAGAPFGMVAIDESCSFCMACVGGCPSGALVSGGEMPRLSLVESRCHQCGLCAAVCPENSIQLQPRLLCNTEAATTPAVLREVEPFKCIECGEPFATTAMISRMQEKLNGHWMYNSSRQVRRLRMCRACRTRDALLAGDYQ